MRLFRRRDDAAPDPQLTALRSQDEQQQKHDFDNDFADSGCGGCGGCGSGCSVNNNFLKGESAGDGSSDLVVVPPPSSRASSVAGTPKITKKSGE